MADSDSIKLCECGCGRPTPIATRTRYGNIAGQPTRFLRGHPGRPKRVDNIAGRRFGRWTALSYLGDGYWLCRCECGTESRIRGPHLADRRSTSCGCYRRENPNHKTHGLSKTKLYRRWCDMRKRCTDPNYKQYKDYGGRGIKVCERWQNYESFLADMGEPPTPEHSLDRYPNNDGNYEPGNVRWATRIEQNNNKRTTKRSCIE